VLVFPQVDDRVFQHALVPRDPGGAARRQELGDGPARPEMLAARPYDLFGGDVPPSLGLVRGESADQVVHASVPGPLQQGGVGGDCRRYGLCASGGRCDHPRGGLADLVEFPPQEG
jgi:hypothetical protein